MFCSCPYLELDLLNSRFEQGKDPHFVSRLSDAPGVSRRIERGTPYSIFNALLGGCSSLFKKYPLFLQYPGALFFSRFSQDAHGVENLEIMVLSELLVKNLNKIGGFALRCYQLQFEGAKWALTSDSAGSHASYAVYLL